MLANVVAGRNYWYQQDMGMQKPIGKCSCKQASDFNVGDEVICVYDYPEYIGRTAIVISNNNGLNMIGIRWDRTGETVALFAERFEKIQ